MKRLGKPVQASLGPSNDDIPEDEMVLAQLIQNAQAYGLASCQTAPFKGVNGSAAPTDALPDPMRGSYTELQFDGLLAAPPTGAVACCVMGAQLLSPKIDGVRVGVFGGNDAADEIKLSKDAHPTFVRSWGIGAAFEQALRPESAGF